MKIAAELNCDNFDEGVLYELSKICSDSFVPTWRVCSFLPSHIQGRIEEVKVDQEDWEKFGVCGAKECCRGFVGATLLIRLHGNGAG